ncbi:uncharacterized protein BDZ83DRAFT_356150 [Colletotrichum acutatum]|uniref:Secreted protein n=1 Tax=Glomerella acutata TaxID=27357 RepID=A0AAD8UHE8_GLOAC|nr:uncharacterized protein BDZ83DRAFT_356150 [Colletotrichum acutatum]KAK1724337.1 hypothetical protein BDZ83DRAFT_356150 [Colletotrichum acutatum]
MVSFVTTLVFALLCMSIVTCIWRISVKSKVESSRLIKTHVHHMAHGCREVIILYFTTSNTLPTILNINWTLTSNTNFRQKRKETQ